MTDGVLALDDQCVVLYANAPAHILLDRGDLAGKNCGLPVVDSFDTTDVRLVCHRDILWAQLLPCQITWQNQAARVITLTEITECKRTEDALHFGDVCAG